MTLPRIAAFACAVLFCTPATAAAADEHGGPPDMAQMSFLAGGWIEAKNGRTVEEHWVGPVGGVMAGLTIIYADTSGAKTTVESMGIVIRDGRFTFIARPAGQPETAFPLKEADNGYAVFENLAHDFPQRVIYSYGGDDTLDARIEGTIDGKAQSMEWHYVRKPR